MLVAGIEKKRNSGLCIIKLDNLEIIEVSLDLVLKYQIGKNSVISTDIITKLLSEQRKFNIRQSALSYASYKPRTVKQVKEKLILKGFNADETREGIDFLYKFNLLDDKKFAKSFVKDYLKRKPAGEQKLYFELIKKGISKELAKETVKEHFSDVDDFELAMKAAQKKLSMFSNKPDDKKRNSLIAYLARQGFSWEVIRDVIKSITDESTKSV